MSRRRITQKKTEKVVETNASGKDDEMKVQGRKTCGGGEEKEEKERTSNEAQEEKRSQEKEVVEKVQRICHKDLWMRRSRKAGKE